MSKFKRNGAKGRNVRSKAKNGQRRDKAIRLATSGETLRLRTPAASCIVVPLRYVDPSFIYGNNGSTVWSRRWLMNSAYDPDPAIGGGSMTYYNDYAAMYKRYRVIEFHYDIEFVNQMASSVIASVCPTKDDLGLNYAQSIDFGETVGGKSRMVGSSGSMNRVRFKGKIDLASFSGHTGYLTDDVTSALVSASPNQTYYFNVSGNSNLTQTSSSFAVRVQLVYHTVFFDRVSPFAE